MRQVYAVADLEVHGAALVAHPVGTLDALLPGRASTVTRLTLLVGVERLVVEELLQRDDEHVALHGADAARRHDALRLAERTQERLAGPDVRLRQARREALEAEAVKARQKLGRVELVAADWTAQQRVDAAAGRRLIRLTMISCRSHLAVTYIISQVCLGGRHTARSLPARLPAHAKL